MGASTPLIPLVLLLIMLIPFPYIGKLTPSVHATTSPTFTFATSGDIGSLTSATGSNVLASLGTSSAGFFLGLGDLSYDSSVAGDTWCSQFKAKYSNIQILSGDHDTGGHNSISFGETSSYERYVNNCSFTLGVPITCGPVAGNCYGKEYYFDYPATNPLTRFIFASPKIYNMTGVCTQAQESGWPNCSSQTGQPCTDQYGCWPYSQGNLHYNWVSSAIDSARSSGIKWVIVATHKLCISASDATCSMGIAFFNMLLAKKVDLIIQAHDNAYERGKQLSLNNGTCTAVNTNGNGYAVYNSGCVVDDGSKGYYSSGVGTVLVIQGAWKNDLYTVNDTSHNSGQNAAEAPYFAKLMGSNTVGAGLGFVKYAVSSNRIDVQTSLSSSFQDSFSIASPQGQLSATFNYTPANPTPGVPVSFSAAASGGVSPYSFSWNFGEGSTGSGSSITHTYSTQGNYTVTLEVQDSASPTPNTTVVTHLVTVSQLASWNPNVVCSPTVITLSQEYNGGSLSGSQWQTSSSSGGISNKRDLAPSCTITNINGQVVPALVQISGVYISGSKTEDCATSYNLVNGGGPYPDRNGDGNPDTYCDTTGPVQMAGTSGSIHYEIDHDWDAAGYCGPGVPPCDNVTLGQYLSNGGISLDVQGFVYWDPSDVSPHWELHPLTGWKLSSSPPPQPQPLTASFTHSPSNPSPGVTVSFTATASGGVPPYSFSWNFGDGSTGLGSSVTHSYSGQGNYTVSLAVKDSVYPTSHIATATETLTVLPPTLAVSITGPSSGLVSTGVTFTATASSGTSPYSFSWNFGDGTGNVAGGSTNPNTQSHTYAKTGTFTVKVNATDSKGKIATASSTINISTTTTPLSISLSGPGSGNVGNSLSFTATATGGASPYSLSWTATGGNPSSGTGSTFTTFYSTQGTYTVSVTVTDANAKTASSSTTITINPPTGKYTLSWQGFDWDGGGEETLTMNGRFLASLLASDTPANANVYTAFSLNITSFVVQGTNTLLFTHANWDCSVSDNVKNLQVTSGTSVVYSNSTIEPLSCTQSLSYRFTIAAPLASPALVASYTYSPTNSTAGQTVTFTATASNGVSPYLFNWSFGDGSTSSGQTATHAYGQGGTFTVKLTVTDSSQNIATSSQTVTVTTSTLSASFTFSPSFPQAGQQITFTASATGGTASYSYTWNFGDGSTGTGSSVAHAYSSGSYTITLTVKDSGSPQQTATSQQTLTVVNPSPPPLTATFTYNPSSPVVGQTVMFSASASGGTSPYTYIWSFGDGTTGTGSSLTHTYSVAGSYNVTLTTTDSSGQSVTSSKTVVVSLRNTATSVSCPVSGTPGVAFSCSVTISDVSPGTANTPTGTIRFVSTSTGAFNQSSCTLTATATVGVASCSVAYTPTVAGRHEITGSYGGDSAHVGSIGTATVTVGQTQSYALVVSYDGSVFKYQNGTLTLIGQPVTTGLRQAAWKPDGSYALIVGNAGVLLKYNGSFTQIPTGLSSTIVLYSVGWKPDGSYALITGSSGLVLKFDGISLVRISSSTSNNLYRVGWNPAGTQAILVGASGAILVFQNSLIQPISSGTTNSLNAIAWNPNGQYALIAGAGGTILRCDGVSITALNTAGIYSSTLAVESIAWNQAGTLALLVGDYGLVLSYDGTSLTALPTLTSNFLWSVSWSGGTATIVGGSGTVMTYTNGTLTKIVTNNSSSLRGIAWKPS